MGKTEEITILRLKNKLINLPKDKEGRVVYEMKFKLDNETKTLPGYIVTTTRNHFYFETFKGSYQVPYENVEAIQLELDKIYTII
jgi:hypothetical protein